MNLNKYGQYKRDIFQKLNFNFETGKKILDLGCGDCTDAEIFIEEYGLDTHGIDIYAHANVSRLKNFQFKQAGIFAIPFADNTFDYVFLHDVLHHVDEQEQDFKKHIAGLKEVGRVAKMGGKIIILEGNRYNPLFYPHMVKASGHNHFKQTYFKKIIQAVFDDVAFKYFECHFYPEKYLKFWKVYEKMMEKFCPEIFLAYNVAIIRK